MIKKNYFHSIKSLDSFFVWKMMAQTQGSHGESLLLVLARSSFQISVLSLKFTQILYITDIFLIGKRSQTPETYPKHRSGNGHEVMYPV